jgi:hypothetical protein
LHSSQPRTQVSPQVPAAGPIALHKRDVHNDSDRAGRSSCGAAQNNGADASAIVDGIVTVGKVADVVDKVKKALDDVDPGRSVILTVHNNTNQPMLLNGQDVGHGDFGVPPMAELPANKTVVFGGKSAGLFTGTEGHVFYSIAGTVFDVYWDNPYIGGNGCDLHATGLNPLDFALHHACGAGNNDAQMDYEIYQQPSAFGAMLVNKNANLALDVPGFSVDDVLIQQYDPNGGPNQRWIFTKLSGDGPGSVYILTNQSGQEVHGCRWP